MKKWIDRILGILLVMACIFFAADMLLNPGKHSARFADNFNFNENYLFSFSALIIIVGVYWVYASFKRKAALSGKDMDTGVAAVSKGSRITSWVYWGSCILIITVHVVFIIRAMQWAYNLENMQGPIFVSIMAIAVALLCFFTQSPFFQKKSIAIIKGSFFGIACALTVYICFIHLAYLPKYTESEAFGIIKNDARFASAVPGKYGYMIEDNPFIQHGYLFYWSLSGEELSFNSAVSRPEQDAVGIIFSNPATGKYEYSFDGKYDEYSSFAPTYSFSSSTFLRFTSDKTTQYSLHMGDYHDTIEGSGSRIYLTREKMSDKDVKNFINEKSDQELISLLKEIVPVFLKYYDGAKAEWMTPSSGLVITIQLYDTDIATYRNGSITLIK